MGITTTTPTLLAAAPLPPAAPDPEPPAVSNPLASPAGAPAPSRATIPGAIIGGGTLAAAGLVTGVVFCAAEHAADDNICQSTGRKVLIPGVLTLAGGVLGALVGASIGAAIPLHHSAETARFEREAPAHELGFATLAVGATSVQGKARVEAASPALRASFMAQLGRYFAAGPELGYYPQTRWRPPQEQHDGFNTDRQSVLNVGMVVRAGLPLGALLPYAQLAAGLYDGYGEGLIGSAGLGVDWRWSARLSFVADVRLHGKGTGALRNNTPFVAGTAGAAWHW
jgi:hypothetical protein